MSYQPNGLLCSQNAGLLVVPRISNSRMLRRAFIHEVPVQVRDTDTSLLIRLDLSLDLPFNLPLSENLKLVSNIYNNSSIVVISCRIVTSCNDSAWNCWIRTQIWRLKLVKLKMNDDAPVRQQMTLSKDIFCFMFSKKRKYSLCVICPTSEIE